MQRGITKYNRLGANSSPIAESSVKAVSLKRNKKMYFKWITQNDIHDKFIRDIEQQNRICTELKNKSDKELKNIIDQTNNSITSSKNTISDEFRMFEAIKELKSRG
jgi:hypothetical protein